MLDIGAAAACALNESHSQWGEDLALLPTLLHLTGGRRGRYLEMGALDGVRFSNTIMLERCFGWSGVLIEANPRNFESLKESGRRSATFVHSAVCSPAGSIEMTIRGGEVAGQVGRMSATHIQRWQHKNALRNGTVYVPCRPLSDILDARPGSIDFFSLGEGGLSTGASAHTSDAGPWGTHTDAQMECWPSCLSAPSSAPLRPRHSYALTRPTTVRRRGRRGASRAGRRHGALCCRHG